MQEKVHEQPLCCESGGEMERMIQNIMYSHQTSAAECSTYK